MRTVALSMGIVLALSVTVLAACYEECINCAADPVFIMRDRRNPGILPKIRDAKAKGLPIIDFPDGSTVILANDESDKEGAK